jgi:Protein of unknown function (DUF3298)
MTRKNLIVFAIVVIAALAAAVTVFSILSKKPSVVVPTGVVEPATEVSRPKAAPLKTEKVIGEYYKIDLEYPKATVGALEGIDAYIERVKADFFTVVPKNDEEAADIGMTKDRAYILDINTIVYTSSSTITYKLETYTDTGGAHGSTFVTTFTYNKEGKLINLNDILTGSDSLKKVSDKARPYFYSKLKDATEREIINMGTEPEADNFSTWYITDAGITFVMQQYQIGPYVIGIQEFLMTRAQADGILKLER